MHLDEQAIHRNENGLAETSFCRETPDGGLNIVFHADVSPYELGPENLVAGPAFAEIWQHLNRKLWFTPEIAVDLVNVVTARWLAKDRGLI